MTRSEQLADAYIKLARADHYMIGIIETVTADERDAAEQILITQQNSVANDTQVWAQLELALDVLENDRKRARI